MVDLISKIKKCNNCPLHCNQSPLIDNNHASSDVFWIGLSAVKVSCTEKEVPLSSLTSSGKLIAEIESMRNDQLFYKTNIVKCLPLKDSKIRYPSTCEMKACFNNLELEISTIKPRTVFLLGKQVTDFVGSKFGFKISKLNTEFNYERFMVNGIEFIPIHHPSYVLVYQRKNVQMYRDSLANLI